MLRLNFDQILENTSFLLRSNIETAQKFLKFF